ERLDRKVGHGLEHRDLNQAAAVCAAALDQRAENAVGGIQARDRVGERRAQELRALIVDYHAQKAAQRLGHRVIAGPVDVRARGAEAADRAVDQARIDLVPPFDADAETL